MEIDSNTDYTAFVLVPVIHFLEDPNFRIPLSQEEPLYTFYVFSPIAKILLNENVTYTLSEKLGYSVTFFNVLLAFPIIIKTRFVS